MVAWFRSINRWTKVVFHQDFIKTRIPTGKITTFQNLVGTKRPFVVYRGFPPWFQGFKELIKTVEVVRRPVVRSFAEPNCHPKRRGFLSSSESLLVWRDQVLKGGGLGALKTPTDLVVWLVTPKRWLSKGIQFAQIDRWWFHSDFHCHFLPLITWEFMNPEILRAHILFKSGCKNKTPRSAILFDCIFSDGTESSRSIRTCYSSSFSLHKEQTKVRSRCGCKVRKTEES